MIRLIVVAALVIGFLIFSFPVLVAQNSLGKKDPRARDLESTKIIRSVFTLILKCAGVKVTVKGAENIPKDTAVLFVGNHRSYFDILVGYTTVPGLMGFVAKKEMESIPLLRSWMRNVNCLFLDRENIKEGLKTILEGIEKVKNGVSVWIYPEGTRNRNQDLTELLPFKEGSLKIAEKSGCPVVPVAMIGTAEVFESHFPFIRPSDVTVYYGTPFYVKELEPEQRKRAGAYTQERIREMLIELQNEKAGE
jgi:1-acyl-sn-glycerol-3-phosphate acyltransferase